MLDLLQHGRPVAAAADHARGNAVDHRPGEAGRDPELTGAAPLPAEGTVLPDSYGYQRGETRAAVLERMTDAMDKELAALWAKRKPTARSSTKPQEAVILASIVEKETGKAGRAADGRRGLLQPPADRDEARCRPDGHLPDHQGQAARPADPAVGAQRRSPATTPIAKPGLPDGPIANPGRESIAAVLDPAPTKALYFVADGTGGHVFADTLAEHNANVAKWYAIRRARGEM